MSFDDLLQYVLIFKVSSKEMISSILKLFLKLLKLAFNENDDLVNSQSSN